MSKIKKISVWCAVSLWAVVFTGTGNATAAEAKIGFINMQQVLASSEAGKNAQAAVAEKMEELQAGFKKDQDALVALQQEIEKKSSAWSDEMKQEKGIEFQKMRRDLAVKQEDAQLELKQLRGEKVEPILQELKNVVKDVAKEQGYTLVLPHNVILYAEDSADITASVTKALNKAMK